MARVGDFVVVEDTNISWVETHDVRHTQQVCATAWTHPKWTHTCSCGLRWESMWEQSKCSRADVSGDRGARGGLEDYLRAHEGEFVQDILCERYLLTMNPGGFLQRVKACEHV
jgi:cephalosporin hydroxylase